MIKWYIIKATFLALLMVQMLTMVSLYLRHNNFFSTDTLTKNPSKVHILIVSSWRSGSSFLGQVFSQHPDVFYLMEPVWHLWMNMKRSNAKVLQMAARDLIRSVFQCDMSVYDAYLPEKPKASDLFMWHVSRALCSPPVCDLFERTQIIKEDDCKTLCKRSQFNKVAEACHTYSHIALKEVRLFDLKSIYPLVHDSSLNLKIIHLVRDPRAVFRSRHESSGILSIDTDIILNGYGKTDEEVEYKAMKEICNSYVNIYKDATNSSLNVFKNCYMLVRYEDLVRDPLEKVKEMYRFAQLDFPPNFEEWIYAITHGKDFGKNGMAFKTTSRNALNVSQAWRNSLSFQAVSKVQDNCKEAMSVFGYKPVKSDRVQKLMSMDLLLPMESNNGSLKT
ncbi:carbohydrate sulfotransferase 5-like [Protopterus annectens]|uniref:carbohydrate sulfotransferase 5-like n=1 Tax=Protopterus annectens TaxID=7888 RepID=UPI001CFACD23|nr:carbohydrate sulfotransferase 5-like [Protopterus annectens]XP_043937411.1 carbohydrate sulfotransferase 5-like [Protopterus annectens]XP_043937412.1 carbohydrate sulfotransferase 5-like [Protopterus annectens]